MRSVKVKDDPEAQEQEIGIPTMFREGYLTDDHVGVPQEVYEKNSAFRAVKKAMDSSRQMLEKIERVRQADLKNERLSETGRRLETWKYWKKNFAKFEITIGEGEEVAQSEADAINKKIKNGLRRTAKNSQLSIGIWQILRDIPEKADRISYIRNLIKDASDDEDQELVEIVLGSNPQLTGINRDDRQHLRELYENKFFAEDIAVRDNLLKAVDLLKRGHDASIQRVRKALYTSELEKIEAAEKAAAEARA